jgi:D-glycero-alpha-D-manno-heptose-7-phosphate kinase
VLNEHWRYKTRLSDRVSNPCVDQLYSLAMQAGAEGGKLLGAGGGGFLLVAAKEGQQDRLRKAMIEEGLRELPFKAAPEGSAATELAL